MLTSIRLFRRVLVFLLMFFAGFICSAFLFAAGASQSDIAKGIKNKEFKLYLQPIYDLNSNTIAGGEALVRWHKPGSGIIMPDDFIPGLESVGNTKDFDIYMLTQAATMLADFVKSGQKHLPVSINISRHTLHHSGIADIMIKAVKSVGAEPSWLEIEVTESLKSPDINVLARTLSDLKSAGFIIDIDDFGSAYSTLLELKALPADVLKIDKGLLLEDENAEKGKKIVSSVIDMAKALNMIVVAEGVETAAQADFLRQAGCEYGQGYYFSKPVISAKFLEMIK